MEKKNTILLTVIAIATLLVAVVGATFAYFTAQVGVQDNTREGSVNAKAYTMASAEMDRGADITNEGIYPGTVIVKPLVITGACADAKGCQDINTIIKVTTDIDKEFGNDVSWKIVKAKTANSTEKNDDGTYKVDATTNEITCTPNNIVTGGQYYAESGCNVTLADYEPFIATATGNTSNEADQPNTYELDLKVTGTTRDTYYLIVEYKNHEDVTEGDVTTPGTQNNQQGKSFKISVNYLPKA